MKTLLQSLRLLAALTLLTGFLYPLLVTGVGRVLFPEQSGGSLIRKGDRVIGSALLAQKTESARFFSPRPSAGDFATVPSAASNLAPTSAALQKAVAARRITWGEKAPPDLLTASGSGLDPHLSPAAARHQAARVAEARGLPEDAVLRLIEAKTEAPQLGFLGEPRVNVLALNLALDAAK
ncbi:MAG TPA: potassium-transporting ATPase subunit KdpC [Chthoniobacteraceae bacterium]|jgi:K+-transporting ATPase ATPase C chain